MFKGLGNLGNIASMVGSLQKLPEKLNELNERMKQEEVSASSVCGKVNITMTGTGHVQSVEIAPALTPRTRCRTRTQSARYRQHADQPNRRALRDGGSWRSSSGIS